jgi:hypothetical protein
VQKFSTRLTTGLEEFLAKRVFVPLPGIAVVGQFAEE